MSSVEAPEGRTVNSLAIILVKCAPEGLAPPGLETANLFFTCPLNINFFSNTVTLSLLEIILVRFPAEKFIQALHSSMPHKSASIL